MKKFKIPCDFAGKKVPFDLYVGQNDEIRHPLHFQKIWLESERGGKIPLPVLDSFQKLSNIAVENNTDFEELTMYALGSAASEKQGTKKAIIEGQEVSTINYFEVAYFKTYFTTERLFDNQRKFRQVFLKNETGYIYFELALKNKLFGWLKWNPNITFKCFQIIEEQEAEEPIFEIKESNSSIDPENHIRKFANGWGNEKPGVWKAGHYRIKAFIDEEEMSKQDFYVNDFAQKINDPSTIFQLKEILIYEADKNQEEKNPFTYQYEAQKTRFIHFTLQYKNLWQQSAWFAEVRVIVLNEAFELKASFNKFQEILPDHEMNDSEIMAIDLGYGASVPSFWGKGKYYIKFFLFNFLISGKEIEII